MPEAAAPARSPRPPRPRGRTAALIAGAAALGVLTGVVIGYTVQYDRPPTPLPPLSQAVRSTPEPHSAAAGGKDGPEPLSAREDRIVRTGGDLRKLLLKKPKGAQIPSGAPDGDWMTPARYAEGYEHPAGMFEGLAQDTFRRAAAIDWERSDGAFVSIRLIQFRDTQNAYSADFLEGQQAYMSDDKFAGHDGDPIPGTGSGRVYVYDRPHTEAGYLPMYTARALARRGDIVMEIFVNSSKAVSRGTIMSLAERQLERL
ncbi:hypothetical protein Sfr7A_30225 [Streptomyces xinghaiensis]|uniref:Uncharacterized protein n=1 Tax=Streptomyces xinghaiensis TaxID=1038928 RepID=A0A420UUK8_9ACTN|nr:hypothetical protein Sfr7A_30225 [Streptomyces xinghaiensis]RKM90908.1 hypothetical protein SFRA_030720 [Streptomyces xinghaiensis]RNC68857.1 hypothetical protein DC095_031320 [Streptomyces xinghaiensis]